ncbi:hypothetical protein BH10ACI1_BH10ACI1_10020 [soil metagenome]
MKLDFESNTSTFTLVGSEFLDSVERENNSAGLDKMLREGIHAAQNGKPAQARSLLLNVTEIDPNNEKAWLWLASISEYPEELIVFLNSVLRINPENSRALEWAKATKSLLSKTFVQRGIETSNENSDRAKQYFLQAVSHDENNEMAWLWLASISPTDEEKSANLEKVLSINSENITAKSLLESINQKKCETLFQNAAINAVAGNFEQAKDFLEDYFSKSSKVENAWLLKSFLVRSFAEKSDCFEQVLKADPANELAQLNLDFLRSMMEKSEVEQPATEIEFSDPVGADEEGEINSAPDFGYQVQVEEADSEDEIYTAQSNFESRSAEAMEFAQTDTDEVKAEIEEVQFSEADEVKEEFVESQTESSGDSEKYEETEERGFTFSDLEESTDGFVEAQNPFDEPAENEFHYYSVSERSSENEENGAELLQTFAADTYSEVSEQPELEVEDVRSSVEFADAKVESEFSMESYSQPAESDYTNNYESSESESNAENNYSHLFVEGEDSEADSDIYVIEEMEAMSHAFEEQESQPQVEISLCSFCEAENEPQSFVCDNCCAVKTLSNLEMVLANQDADKEMIGYAVQELENERERRELDSDEMKQLALGYLNLGNFSSGLFILNEASKMNPDDIVLSSQLNALKIRLEELDKQREIHNTMSKNLTILVVDDSATVRKLISGKLEKSGHEVVCAIDGIDALEKIKDIVPDLILLDINMPRMDGYQVCKIIRTNEQTKDVPVVMISGKDGFFDKVRGRMAGTTGYITKPFGPETLMKTVETYIN